MIMIDYDKLKIAHTIASKINRGLFTCNFHSPDFLEFSFTSNDGAHYVMRDIDDAILKLTEMMKPEPKFAHGSIVFCMWQGDIHEFTVAGIEWNKTYLDYVYINPILTDKSSWLESQLYNKYSSLVEAQVEYWQNLADEAKND